MCIFRYEDSSNCTSREMRVICQASSCSSMVEQRPPKPKVGGSIPLMDAFFETF